ncbi:P-loop containing nucleoside triphosphate hydrolase protein [Aspergillus karnatakaensis]|uniref:P-loop containing nucleoside triphosphate hydrolase protein n=1 Tax=Aspergillus karnatakaensis TaxID=1810916 RepID=UPI003CCDB9D7
MSLYHEANIGVGWTENKALGPCRVPLPADGDHQSLMDFRGGRPARETDIFIAVMGVTGSGKSSFTSCCSRKEVKLGHRLEACTAEVGVYAYDASPNRTIYLIDTAGFDDTNRTDGEVLRGIAQWLVRAYKGQILLKGIIYLHRITDTRMPGSARKNLLMFRHLCGEEALQRVVPVTTMWDKLHLNVNEAARREQELVNTPDPWKQMVEMGSFCRRHDNTVESARNIVDRLASYPHAIATDLQKQIVDQSMNLGETAAG